MCCYNMEPVKALRLRVSNSTALRACLHGPRGMPIACGACHVDLRSCSAALAHQNNFDIAWCRGSVSELLFAPVRAPACTPAA